MYVSRNDQCGSLVEILLVLKQYLLLVLLLHVID